MTQRDKMHLGYLAKAVSPLWGGHLQRGEPISDPDMRRWVELGWIEQVGHDGYVLSAKGEQLLQQTPGA